MFHPNVYNDGSICLDILQNQWSPIYDVGAIFNEHTVVALRSQSEFTGEFRSRGAV